MTRAQCETLLLQIFEFAFSLYKTYNPNGDNLSMYKYGDSISISDNLTDENGNFIDPRNYDKAHTVYITKFDDGKTINGSEWRRLFGIGGDET